MSLNLNHVTMAGRLTRDPEMKVVGADQTVSKASLALNRRWKDKSNGETKEEVTFIDLEAWGRTATLMHQYLKKGSPVYVEGRLKMDQWQDPQGQTRQRMKVVVNTMQLLDSRPNATNGNVNGNGNADSAEREPEFDNGMDDAEASDLSPRPPQPAPHRPTPTASRPVSPRRVTAPDSEPPF